MRVSFVALVAPFLADAASIRNPSAPGSSSHFMARLVNDGKATVHSQANHYGCVEICGAGEGRCIAACEVDMYTCSSMAPPSAQDACFEEKTEKYANFEKPEKVGNGTNGSNETAFFVASAHVEPHFVASKSNHYGCVEICKAGEGRCIAACETEMYWCEGKPTKEAEEECLTTTTDKFKNFEKEEGNATAGNGTNKSALLAATTRIVPNLVVSKDKTVHYRCQSICSVRYTSENNGMCISECETAMYRCQSMSTDDEVKACETKIEDKWTKVESGNATNGTNGTNGTK